MKLPLSPPLVEGIEEKPKDIIKFTAENLSIDEVSQLVISSLCGAGKKLISLEYEAYLPMAENEIRKICMFQRLGLVPVSEASVIITVSSVHRASSLQAAEGEAGSRREAQCGTRSPVSRIRPWAEGSSKLLSHAGCPAIDTLKAKVPIWKKEIYEELSSSWKRNKECFWATDD
ncbi:unnamed protein product [Nyctereutes procyonoides]|uniref:(raccoon dog) hypothetical protein n=1 Tax=Nyctereutes procyonoides TaxID=34880 RepID=A0A811YML4_NYCPR|nr:unnamed protein product [Nyctereutes procyonoides]